jgi:hypothetical protein
VKRTQFANETHYGLETFVFQCSSGELNPNKGATGSDRSHQSQLDLSDDLICVGANNLTKVLNRDRWLANMNHPVAVCTKYCKILEFGFGTSTLCEWNLVVTLCETIASIAIDG